MLLGFTGKLGSGKDTAYLRLKEIVTVPVVRISFADKLKQSAAAIFGGQVSVELLDSLKGSDAAVVLYSNGQGIARVTVREFLQYYGTEAHRDLFGEYFWVDAAMPPVATQVWTLDKENLYVVTDVRFPNEQDRVGAHGGLVVRVKGADEKTGSHASEQVLPGVDWTIDNSIRDDDYAWLDSQLRSMLYMNNMSAIIKATSVEALS